MANLQIRINDKLKNQAQQIAQELKIDLTTAIKVFLKQIVNNQGFPFKPETDPFYNPQNQKILNTSIQQLNKEETIIKSLDELQLMEK